MNTDTEIRNYLENHYHSNVNPKHTIKQCEINAYRLGQKELYNKYISKWKKEIESYGNGNKCVGYSQTTFINEFERDLKELEN